MSAEDAKCKKEFDGKHSNRNNESPKYASTLANASQQSKHGSSKENISRRKKKQKHVDDSSRKDRLDDSGKSKRSSRQRQNGHCSAEPLQTSTKIIKRSAESADKPRISQRERNCSAEKIESTMSRAKKIFSGEKCDGSNQPQKCSNTFGYGRDFPDSLLEELSPIECKVEPPKKVPVLKVSKTLIIYEVPQELSAQMEIGDILFKFNDLQVSTRKEYSKQLSFVSKIHSSQTLTFTILRPIRNKPISWLELSDVFSKLERPQGYEIIPTHFDYLLALLIVAPKTVLGMTIKAYNGKVYVSGIENGINSIAYKSLLVGDAILVIEDQVIAGVKEADDLFCSYFAKTKFVRLIIERPKTPASLRYVKHVLNAEKTFEINPRMTEDVIEICEHQISFMATHPDLKPPQKILTRNDKPRASNSHIDVAREAVEIPISTDVNNATLLSSTPPIPTVPPGTTGSVNPTQNAKRLLSARRSK